MECTCHELEEFEYFETKAHYHTMISIFEELKDHHIMVKVAENTYEHEYECKYCRQRWLLGKYEAPVKGYLFKKKSKF